MPAPSYSGSRSPEPRRTPRPVPDAGARGEDPERDRPNPTAPETTGPQRPFAVTATLWGLGILVALLATVATGVGLSLALNTYSRAEARANANDRVALTRIAIKQAKQQSLISYAQLGAARADAQRRYTEAVGIRRAQDVIAGKLTSQYLQYLAIQAQMAVATSGRNNTLIYLPSGSNGVPLVQDPQIANRLNGSSNP
jgi:hypothetical protein